MYYDTIINLIKIYYLSYHLYKTSDVKGKKDINFFWYCYDVSRKMQILMSDYYCYLLTKDKNYFLMDSSDILIGPFTKEEILNYYSKKTNFLIRKNELDDELLEYCKKTNRLIHKENNIEKMIDDYEQKQFSSSSLVFIEEINNNKYSWSSLTFQGKNEN